VDGLWSTKSEGVGLIIRAISLQDFQPMWSWSTNVTGGRTDWQTDDMRSQYTALCTILHRALKKTKAALTTSFIVHVLYYYYYLYFRWFSIVKSARRVHTASRTSIAIGMTTSSDLEIRVITRKQISQQMISGLV